MESSDLRTQDVLAEALGIDQTAVSRMITGKSAVTVERVATIEAVCGLRPGQILRWAGYVADDDDDEDEDEVDGGVAGEDVVVEGEAMPAAAKGADARTQRVGRRVNRPRPAPEPGRP